MAAGRGDWYWGGVKRSEVGLGKDFEMERLRIVSYLSVSFFFL